MIILPVVNGQVVGQIPKNAVYTAIKGTQCFVYFSGDTLPTFPGPTPQEIAAAEAAEYKLLADSEAARQYTKLRNLTEMSPAQVTAWVSENVTNLAQAQDAIATLAVAVSVLGRRL
jgi:hypothetical protein